MKYNYHSHTKRCGHAIGEDEEYVLAAIEAGYEVLGFSDHAPYRLSDKRVRMDYEEFEGYINSIEYLKEKYKDCIKILMGLEIEFFPSQIEDLLKYRKLLDYCILGQHAQEIDGVDNYYIEDSNQLIDYAKSIYKACELGLCDIVAHPDIFMYSYKDFDKYFNEASSIIIEASLKFDVPIEFNCGGIKYGKRKYNNTLRYPYPTRNFYKMVADNNCKVLVGLDAHSPSTYLDKYWINESFKIVEGINLNILEEYDILSMANKRKEKINILD